MQGWKAFRTHHGHTSKHTPNDGFVIFEHEGSALFPLNVPTKMPDDSVVWFCATKEDACNWALTLDYNYVAPIIADIDVTRCPSGFDAPKYTARQITRTGDMELSGIKPNVALYAAFMFNDPESAIMTIERISDMSTSDEEKSKHVRQALELLEMYAHRIGIDNPNVVRCREHIDRLRQGLPFEP